MKVALQKVFQSVNNKKNIIIAILVFAVLQLALSIQLLASTLSYDRIYKGIYVRDVYVSGMTVDQAVKLVKETYEPRLKTMKISLKNGDVSQKFSPTKFVDSIDFENSVKNAFNEGREGNVVSRLFGIASVSMQGKTVDIDYNYNEAKFQQIIGKFSEKLNNKLEPNTYKILEDKIIINIGKRGQAIDEAKLRSQIIEKVQDFESCELDIPIVVQEPEPLDIDALHRRVFSESKDAAYEVKNYRLAFVPAVLGRDFDVEYAKNFYEQKKNQEGSNFEIPLKITYPQKYEQELKNSLFKDELSNFTTKYSSGEGSRSSNVSLAASKINGTVIGPGDIFSYNTVVGKRTAEEGFKKAHVYAGGKIIDGLGGGICQVSTTLYNVVLFADLEVVERRNHNMLVGYVPPGRDATVSYGSIDFKFRNNFKKPIKIESGAKKGTLSIRILGSNEHPGKKIELGTEILKSYYLPEKVIEDASKPIGYYHVEQKGIKACSANTYKIIKQNGKVVSKTRISTSKYNPLQRIVIKGSKEKKKPVQNQKPKIEEESSVPSPEETEPVTGPDPGIPFDDGSGSV